MQEGDAEDDNTFRRIRTIFFANVVILGLNFGKTSGREIKTQISVRQIPGHSGWNELESVFFV